MEIQLPNGILLSILSFLFICFIKTKNIPIIEAINKQSKPLRRLSQAPMKNASRISPIPTIDNVFFLIITTAEHDIRYNPTPKLPIIASNMLTL